MLDTHLGSGFRLFEVKICHSPLDIERRLNIAHPRLPFRNVLFANAQPCVDLLGLLRLQHGAIVADQPCGGSVKTDSSVEYNQVGGQILLGGARAGNDRAAEMIHDRNRINRVWAEQMVLNVPDIDGPDLVPLRGLKGHLLGGVRFLLRTFQATVQALQEEIPDLGEVVAVDVKHQDAWVRENNLRESITDRFCKERQPRGDPDCRVGVKSSTNQEHADGPTKERKEYQWGYGSGIATATTPDYGDVVLAEFTHPFNESDVSYYLPLFIQLVAVLGHFPLHVTADAAYDAWYVYQTWDHPGPREMPGNIPWTSPGKTPRRSPRMGIVHVSNTMKGVAS